MKALALLAGISLAGCANTGIHVGLGAELDNVGAYGDNPVGIVEISQPVSDRLSIHYTHISSVMGSDIDPTDVVSVRYAIKEPGND